MQIPTFKLTVSQILALRFLSIILLTLKVMIQGDGDEDEIPKEDEPQAPPGNGGEIEKDIDDIPDEEG